MKLPQGQSFQFSYVPSNLSFAVYIPYKFSSIIDILADELMLLGLVQEEIDINVI